MDGRATNWRDGWHADDIHEVVCTWLEMRLLGRSEEHGLSLALCLETRFSVVSRSTPAAFSMQSAASRRPQDGANPRRCGPSSGRCFTRGMMRRTLLGAQWLSLRLLPHIFAREQKVLECLDGMDQHSGDRQTGRRKTINLSDVGGEWCPTFIILAGWVIGWNDPEERT